MKAKKLTAVQLLDIDEICLQLEAGDNQTVIAKRWRVSRYELNKFLALPHNSARARESRAAAAATYADMAEEVIKNARGSLGFAKARELAHHYRWRASKAAPREFGDKIQAEVDTTLTIQINKVT